MPKTARMRCVPFQSRSTTVPAEKYGTTKGAVTRVMPSCPFGLTRKIVRGGIGLALIHYASAVIRS